MKKKVTLKQKRTLDAILENPRISKRQAMLKGGYSQAMADHPQDLDGTEGWQYLLQKYLPDNKILNKVDEGLEANRVISAINTNKQANGATTDFIEVPDHAVRHKFIETALKLKNRLIPDALPEGSKTVNIMINNYGHNDPLQVLSTTAKPASDPRFIPSSEVSGDQLASEGSKDNSSHQ